MGVYYKRKNIKWLKCQYCNSYHPAKVSADVDNSTCSRCQKEWNKLRGFKKHIQLQQAVFWHNCDTCDRLFSSGGYNTQNCSDCINNLNEFRKAHGLSHFVKKIKYIPCEVCGANHAVSSRHNSNSLCWICRKVKEVSIGTINCVDCNAIVCTDVNIAPNIKRCKSCQKQYKNEKDKQYQKRRRNHPDTKQMMAERNKKNQARILLKKYFGKTSAIKYNECASCQKHFIYRGKTEEYLCIDCNERCKKVNVTYKKCIDCNSLQSMKLRGSTRWKRCNDCNKELAKKYRKTESYKQRKRAYKKETGLNNHRQRARKFGVYYEPVNKSKVFKKDKNICQVCGCKCNKINNHPRQATLGHIIPLSRGGSHTYTNVRTECRQCNIERATSCDNEQITLFTDTKLLMAGESKASF